MLETERVRFDVPQQALQLVRIHRAADPSERLPCEITRAVDVGAPGFARFVESLVRGVRAEDEQERQHGRRERERQRGYFESGEPFGELVLQDTVVDDGHEHRQQRAKDNWRAERADHPRVQNGPEVPAMAPGGFVPRPFGVPVYLVAMHLQCTSLTDNRVTD